MLISEGPVEFCVSAENSNKISVANTFLNVRKSMIAGDGTALAEDFKHAPECNFLHTL